MGFRSVTRKGVMRWLAAFAIAGLAACAGGCGDAGASSTTGSSSFTVTSTGSTAGGAMPLSATCDGAGQTPPLAWQGAPTGTVAYAVVMSTIPGPGTVKYNWLLYGLGSDVQSLPQGVSGVGVLGEADDNGGQGYAPPCSQGPGTKEYTFTVHALSRQPDLTGIAASAVTGDVLLKALAGIELGAASITLTNTRSVATIDCADIRASFANAAADGVSVDCGTDGLYAAVSTTGLQLHHPMMDGITATNMQVPLAQNFTGDNAWHLPLQPAVATTTTTAVDGPIGIAVDGVPIFNPCKQGGCDPATGGGDTKVLGELDLCNGHAGRADDYHYHAAPVCLMADEPATYWDTHPVGWALDGFAIMGYRDPDGQVATRDSVCGGNTNTVPGVPGGYAYHVTDDSPYVLSCFRGTPGPDLAGQGAKYAPLRSPPTGPGFGSGVTNLRLAATAQTLAVGGNSTMTWDREGVTYQVTYERTSATCWNFTFAAGGVQTDAETYCRSF
jgi:phosphatidylethanolamine-binding protein (PEBP) family uncharacterized protein